MCTDNKRETGKQQNQLYEKTEMNKQDIKMMIYRFAIDISDISLQSGKGIAESEINSLPASEKLSYLSPLFITGFLSGDLEDIREQDGHECFLEYMKKNGWTFGPKNIELKTHPDMVPWKKLPRATRNKYKLLKATLIGASGVYDSLKDIFKKLSGQGSFAKIMNQYDQNCKIDYILYALSLSEAWVKLGKGIMSFNHEIDQYELRDMLLSKSAYFIKACFTGREDTLSNQEAHEKFLDFIKDAGWTYGPENFGDRTYPTIVPWEELSREDRDRYNLIKTVVCMSCDLYDYIKMGFVNSSDEAVFAQFDGSMPSSSYH